MKLIVDMNLSPAWINLLSSSGIEAIHWSQIGPSNAPDSEIMAYAHRHGFAVLTHDLDFSAMLAASQDHRPSVIQIRASNVHPGQIGSQVVAALKQMSAELDDGALVTIDPRRTRLRLLPLRPREL